MTRRRQRPAHRARSVVVEDATTMAYHKSQNLNINHSATTITLTPGTLRHQALDTKNQIKTNTCRFTQMTPGTGHTQHTSQINNHKLNSFAAHYNNMSIGLDGLEHGFTDGLRASEPCLRFKTFVSD